MSNSKTTKTAPEAATEVTPKVTVSAEGIVARPLFTTTVEDAPLVVAKPKLSPKTLAEQAAGADAISQY